MKRTYISGTVEDMLPKKAQNSSGCVATCCYVLSFMSLHVTSELLQDDDSYQPISNQISL